MSCATIVITYYKLINCKNCFSEFCTENKLIIYKILFFDSKDFPKPLLSIQYRFIYSENNENKH